MFETIQGEIQMPNFIFLRNILSFTLFKYIKAYDVTLAFVVCSNTNYVFEDIEKSLCSDKQLRTIKIFIFL